MGIRKPNRQIDTNRIHLNIFVYFLLPFLSVGLLPLGMWAHFSLSCCCVFVINFIFRFRYIHHMFCCAGLVEKHVRNKF